MSRRPAGASRRGGPFARGRAALESVRTGRRSNLALLVAFALGVALAAVHWAGLIAGGALVGLVAPSLRRALLYGLYLGVVVLALFGAYLAALGALGTYLALGQVFYLSVAIGLGLPTLAAGVRGLF